MVTYVVMGDPIPLARHRHSGRRTWDSQKQIKLVWGIDIRKQHFEQLGEYKYTGPLHVDIIFYLPMPKCSVKKAQEIRGRYHIFTPDLSNMIKFVEDAATGILFDNDSIVASIASKKIYDDVPRTEFTITCL